MNVIGTTPGLNEAETTELILVVEDEDEVRKVVCLTLELQGYNVLAAARPEHAIELVASSSRPIDLLLTDVIMPELSGVELAQRIGEKVPGLSVLYMSGYSDEELLIHGLYRNEVAFLAKPFSSAALGRKIRQVLREGSQF